VTDVTPWLIEERLAQAPAGDGEERGQGAAVRRPVELVDLCNGTQGRCDGLNGAAQLRAIGRRP
jgi:hypothetical protein